MKRPVVLLLAGAVLGALFGWVTQLPLLIFMPMLVVPLFLEPGRKRYGLCLVLVFLLTFLQAREQKFSPLTGLEGQTLPVQLLITDIGRKSEFTQNYEAVYHRDEGQYRVRFQTGVDTTPLVPGEFITTTAQFRRADRTQNDLLFSYNDYLQRNGNDALLRAEGRITSVGVSDAFSYSVRRSFFEKLDEATDALFSNETARLFRSVIGGRTLFSAAEQETFRDLGISHLFAVSGLHIGIIFGLTQGLFVRLTGKQTARILGLGVILFYTWLIGFPVSAMRALIMAFVLVLARRLRAPYDPLTALFFAATLLLVLFPGSIVDAGFHLSVAGVWSVTWVRPVWLARMAKEGSLFASGLAVQAGILPAMLLHFQRAPLAGVFSNLVLIPLFSLLITAGTLVLGLYFLMPPLSQFLAAVPQMMADVFFTLSDAMAAVALPVLQSAWVGVAAVAWAYLLLYLAIRPNTWFSLPEAFRNGVLRAVLASLAVAALLVRLQPAEILFLDVGQGDAALIKDTGRAMLVDTGGEIRPELSDSLEQVLLPSLRREGVHALDAIFLSHFDADHTENLFGLLERIPVHGIYIPQGLSQTEDVQALLATGIPVIPLTTGQQLTLSASGSIDVVHDARFGDTNDSLVMRYTNRKTSVLFPGDLEAAGEAKLVGNLSAQILKAGHHGSNSSSSDGFLERVQPQLAVITAGHANPYGHPHKEVLERLENRQIPVVRTDTGGNQRLTFRAAGVQVQSYPSLQVGVTELISLLGFVPIGYFSHQISRRHYAARSISKIIE